MNRYQEAGVDVTAGYELVKRIQSSVASTKRSGVMGGIGSFGGMFDLEKLGYQHPVLVSGTDGVGTKLILAKMLGQHDTIGIDCVAMCVNDVLAMGAEPLFFLDYIATGHNDPALLSQVVAGVAAGCRQAGCALIGGETAEMPDMYAPDEYDLAGFTTGVGEKAQLLKPEMVQAGDVLIALPSSGVHSNGFSLVRQILFKDHKIDLADKPAILGGETVGESLLKPTRIYVKSVLPLVRAGLVHGIAHITGGGLIENLPRILPSGLAAQIRLGSWPVTPIFKYLQKLGNLSQQDCLGTFNMGIGLVLAVSPDQVAELSQKLTEQGEDYYKVGRVVQQSGDQRLVFEED